MSATEPIPEDHESSTPRRRLSDHQVQQIIGRLLQTGVLLAAVVVSIGGIALLRAHGHMPVDFGSFRGEPTELSTLTGIARGVAALDSRAVVQLGLVLLIATPAARVALTLVAFALQRDRLYVAITTLVLALLLYGLLGGRA